MKLIGLAGALVLALASPDDKSVVITGCVVKGDGGYVLTNIVERIPASTPSQPLVYWLDDDDDLKDHVGQRVEVTGELKGDVERGEIETEIEDGIVQLEFKSEGKKVTIKLPLTAEAVGTSGSDKPRDIPFVVRKVDVKSVKTVAPNCQ